MDFVRTVRRMEDRVFGSLTSGEGPLHVSGDERKFAAHQRGRADHGRKVDEGRSREEETRYLLDWGGHLHESYR